MYLYLIHSATWLADAYADDSTSVDGASLETLKMVPMYRSKKVNKMAI